MNPIIKTTLTVSLGTLILLVCMAVSWACMDIKDALKNDCIDQLHIVVDAQRNVYTSPVTGREFRFVLNASNGDRYAVSCKENLSGNSVRYEASVEVLK